jgi:muramidase (phage lysozyme)
MDEEQTPKINPSNFFESIERIDKVANNALGRTNSNLNIIEKNQSLIDNLTNSLQSIQTEIQQITQYLIVQQDQREKDLDKQADLLAAREDQQQKRKRGESLTGGGGGDGTSDKSIQDRVNEAVTSTPSILALGGLLAMLMSNFFPKDEDKLKKVELTSPEQLESAKDRLEEVKFQREKTKDMPAGEEKREILDSTKKEISQLENKIKKLEKNTAKDTKAVDRLLKKADTGDESAINKLNFLRDGDSGEYNKHVNIFPEGGSVNIGKTYYVDKTPSEVEELMKFNEQGRIPIGPANIPGIGPSLPSPMQMFKDPSLAMLPRGAEVRSRYDLDLSEYDPSLYSFNIKAERNKSDELKEIEKSKDGKKYREYQDETKRLMKEADEKRKEKNKEKNKKGKEDNIVTASNKNVKKDEQINKSIAYRPEYQELQRAKKDTFGFLFNDKKDKKEDNVTLKLAQQKREELLSRANQIPMEVIENPDGSITTKGSGKLLAGELYRPGEKLSVNQRVAIQGKIMMSGEDSVDSQQLEDFYNSGGSLSKEESDKYYKSEENQKDTKKSDFFGFNEGGPVFDNDDDTSNNDVDSVPAVLTPGEFVVTKDAVEKVGVDTLEGLNASVGATNKASNLGSFSIANDIQDIEISNELEETNYTSKTDVESKIDPLFDDLSDIINASLKGYNQGGLVEGVKKTYSSEIEKNKSKNNLKPLLDMIGSGESDNVGGYSAMFPSESYPEMLDMSINELIEFQKEKLKDGRESVAVGRYQMLYPEDYAAAAGLPLTAKFTPDNQDKMVIAYLKKNRKLNEFLNNEITNEQFSEELSQEFGTFKSASGFVLPNNTGSIDFPMMVPIFNKIKNNLKPIDRSSNNFQSSIENKDVSQILTTMNTDSQIQILPPISSPQNNQIKDNSPVMAQPSQTPLPSTKELVDTNSPVNFINLISNRSLSV